MGLENPLHIAILLLVILLVFGAKRLPDMGRSMGQGMRGFKEALTGPTDGASWQLATESAPGPETEAPSPTSVSEPQR